MDGNYNPRKSKRCQAYGYEFVRAAFPKMCSVDIVIININTDFTFVSFGLWDLLSPEGL